jgi:CheY-like chemotaxis protein
MVPHEQTGAILVVDDDEGVLGLVKAFLEGAGYTVVTAADGADGLTFFERHQAAIVLPQCVESGHARPSSRSECELECDLH